MTIPWLHAQSNNCPCINCCRLQKPWFQPGVKKTIGITLIDKNFIELLNVGVGEYLYCFVKKKLSYCVPRSMLLH